MQQLPSYAFNWALSSTDDFLGEDHLGLIAIFSWNRFRCIFSCLDRYLSIKIASKFYKIIVNKVLLLTLVWVNKCKIRRNYWERVVWQQLLFTWDGGQYCLAEETQKKSSSALAQCHVQLNNQVKISWITRSKSAGELNIDQFNDEPLTYMPICARRKLAQTANVLRSLYKSLMPLKFLPNYKISCRWFVLDMCEKITSELR